MSTGIAPASDSAAQTCCPIVELRQYTLHPGERDVLINLFDREFVEPQEAAGMKIIGQFRDLDNPDRFVWLRGFSDMFLRARALSDFYGGPVWKAHRDAANATMIDSDNVLLLRPARPGSGFSLTEKIRAAPSTKQIPERVILTTIYHFAERVTEEFVEFFDKTVRPEVAAAGAAILAYFMSEQSENTFPALPVRENENVFVWFARFNNLAAYDSYVAALGRSARWREKTSKELACHLKGTSERLRLSPTARSLV
jgi:hypothetical protein